MTLRRREPPRPHRGGDPETTTCRRAHPPRHRKTPRPLRKEAAAADEGMADLIALGATGGEPVGAEGGGAESAASQTVPSASPSASPQPIRATVAPLPPPQLPPPTKRCIQESLSPKRERKSRRTVREGSGRSCSPGRATTRTRSHTAPPHIRIQCAGCGIKKPDVASMTLPEPMGILELCRECVMGNKAWRGGNSPKCPRTRRGPTGVVPAR